MADDGVVFDEIDNFLFFVLEEGGVFDIFVEDIGDVADDFGDGGFGVDEELEGFVDGSVEVEFNGSKFDDLIFFLVESGGFEVEGDEDLLVQGAELIKLRV